MERLATRCRVVFPLSLSFLLLLLVLAPVCSHAEQQTVCVTTFTNLSGSGEDDWLSYFIPDCIENNLKVLPKIKIVEEKWPRSPTAGVSPENPDSLLSSLCAKGKSASVRFILGGDFRRDGEKVSVDIAFVDVSEGKQIGGASFVCSFPELYSRLDDLCASLVGALDLAYSDEQYSRTHAIPTISVEAMTLYGKALATAPVSEERGSLLLKAINKAPHYTDALAKLSVYYYKTGKLAAAQEILEKLARIAPDSAEVCYNLGLVYRSQGHYSRAAEMYRKAVTIEPQDSDAWNNLGVVYYLMEMPEKAAEALTRAIEVNPGNANARTNLELLASVTKVSPQERAADTAKSAETAAAVSMLKQHIDAGAALYATGDYSRAIREFKKALELQPDNFKANNNIALVYMKMGEIEKAREHLKLALKADPTALDVTENLARLQEGARPSNSTSETAGTQPIDQSHALCIAGEVYLSKRAYEEAVNAFSQALAATPNDVDALNGLGTTYFAMAEYEKAQECFKKVLSLDTQNETAKKKLEDVDFVLTATSERPESDQPLRLSIPPEIEARGRLVRGNELYKMGDYEQALSEYRRALDLAPTSVEILNNLGNTYFVLHRYEEARAVFQKAQSLDPDNELIKGNLEMLEMAERASNTIEMKSLERIPRGAPAGQKEVKPTAKSGAASGASTREKAGKSTTLEEWDWVPKNSAGGVNGPKGGDANIRSSANPDSESMNYAKHTAKMGISFTAGKATTQEHKIILRGLAVSAQSHFNAGVLKEEEGDLDGALVEYREAIRLDPGNANAHYNLGNLYFHLWAFQAAIECYRAAVKADPSFAEGYNNIGVAYYKIGQGRKATVAWLQALEANPHMDSALENLKNFSRMHQACGS